MRIDLLKHDEIDFEAYDRCIESSPFGTLYAMSWYLDAVSPGWKLLMAENYRYVMPLPVKKKFGIEYLTQPYFCQQLGVFSSAILTSEIFRRFLSAIPYRIYQLQLNAGNVFDYPFVGKRNNFVLPLNRSYDEIRKNYKKNFIRNIQKAEKENIRIETEMNGEDFMRVLSNNSEGRPIEYLLSLFKELIAQVRKRAMIEIWSVNEEQQSVLSATLFLRWKDRVYYILPVSTPEGKNKQSMAFLLDRFIASHAGIDSLLDFEGSAIPGIARFYESTGAQNEPFPVIARPQALFRSVSVWRKMIK